VNQLRTYFATLRIDAYLIPSGDAHQVKHIVNTVH